MNENEKIDKRTMDDEKTVAKVIDYEKDIAPHRCIGLWACVGSGKNYFAESFITGNAKYGIPQLTVLIITSRKSKVVETLSEFGDEEKLNCRLTNATNEYYFRDKYGYVPDECWKTVLAEDGNTLSRCRCRACGKRASAGQIQLLFVQFAVQPVVGSAAIRRNSATVINAINFL